MKFEPYAMYQCIKSASPGYTEGCIYVTHKNKDGLTCMYGDDGFEDTCEMLVSAFRPVTPKDLEDIAKKLLTNFKQTA